MSWTCYDICSMKKYMGVRISQQNYLTQNKFEGDAQFRGDFIIKFQHITGWFFMLDLLWWHEHLFFFHLLDPLPGLDFIQPLRQTCFHPSTALRWGLPTAGLLILASKQLIAQGLVYLGTGRTLLSDDTGGCSFVLLTFTELNCFYSA